MSVLKRVRDMTLATFNDALEKAEDPVQLIDEYIANQKQKIAEVSALVEQSGRHRDSIKRQVLHALQMVEKRESQAVTALKAGEDELARLALREKIGYEEKAAQYKELLKQGEQSYEDARIQLAQWHEELQEILDKRHYYVTRLELMQLQKKFHQHFASPSNGRHAFRRMEDRMNDMEWEYRAKVDLQRETASWDPVFAEQEKPDVDEELNRLKMKLDGKEE